MDDTNNEQLPKHDCYQVVEKVFLALDGEMQEADMRVFLADINRCSHCLEHYEIEQSFKEFLTHRIARKVPPNGMRDSITAQLRLRTGGAQA
jgi:mycothiol system anti-sigma-R factor